MNATHWNDYCPSSIGHDRVTQLRPETAHLTVMPETAHGLYEIELSMWKVKKNHFQCEELYDSVKFAKIQNSYEIWTVRSILSISLAEIVRRSYSICMGCFYADSWRKHVTKKFFIFHRFSKKNKLQYFLHSFYEAPLENSEEDRSDKNPLGGVSIFFFSKVFQLTYRVSPSVPRSAE